MEISEKATKLLTIMLFIITLIGIFYYVEYRLPTLENNQVEKEK